jgi:hypothetical protein
MGFTLDPKTKKPAIDQATAETPEAIQAVADFAELVGHLRVGDTFQRNAFEASPGDYWDDQTDGRLYRWHDVNGWELIGGRVPYAKTIRGADALYPANTVTPVLEVSIPNAPAGIYWWSFTAIISSAAACKGEIRVQTPLSVIHGPLGFDSPGPAGLRMNFSASGTFGHAGGDLVLNIADFRTTGGAIHQGSIAALHYVRPQN